MKWLNNLGWLAGLAGIAAVVYTFTGADSSPSAKPWSPSSANTAPPPLRPADNTACYECHEYLEHEEITAAHIKDDLLCVDCHGPSQQHREDDNPLIKADVTYGRAEVDPHCEDCHPSHKYPARVRDYLNEWRGKTRENGRVITDQSICTDCHGKHIHPREPVLTTRPVDVLNPADWIPLFNGSDLSGWTEIGKADWRVEDGCIVGTQGPDHAGGDLLTTAAYRDFLLQVTYRLTWPANSGIWFRYQSAGQSYQADLLEFANPEAYSGSIYYPGRLFIAINDNRDLVNRDGWNTMLIRAEGDHIQTWLNGTPLADLHDAGSAQGRIGFQVHETAPFAKMKLTVRKVLLQPL